MMSSLFRIVVAQLKFLLLLAVSLASKVYASYVLSHLGICFTVQSKP